MMGKIFNLEFSFLNKKHKALVSVNNNPSDPYIHIQLIDSIFKNFFSLEHIRYKGFSGYKKLEQYKDPFLQKIMERIGSEVEKELARNYAIVKNIFSCFR